MVLSRDRRTGINGTGDGAGSRMRTKEPEEQEDSSLNGRVEGTVDVELVEDANMIEVRRRVCGYRSTIPQQCRGQKKDMGRKPVWLNRNEAKDARRGNI